MLVLDDNDVQARLRHGPLVEALTAGHLAHAAGASIEPVPTALVLPNGAAHAPTMRAQHVLMSASDSALTLVKVLLDAPARRERAEPAQRSVVTVYSTETGDLLAVIDGRTMTRMRTAAATVLAVRALGTRPQERLGVIGAGALAAEHVRCAVEVLGTEELVLWARRPEALVGLGEIAESAGARWRAASSPSDVLAQADDVVTLTPSLDPLIDIGDLRPGTHVSAVGSPPRPGYREVSAAAFTAADLVVVDDVAIATYESAQIRAAVEAGMAAESLVEIGAVLSREHPGRTSPDAITLHSSIGVALQDLAAARVLLDMPASDLR